MHEYRKELVRGTYEVGVGIQSIRTLGEAAAVLCGYSLGGRERCGYCVGYWRRGRGGTGEDRRGKNVVVGCRSGLRVGETEDSVLENLYEREMTFRCRRVHTIFRKLCTSRATVLLRNGGTERTLL